MTLGESDQGPINQLTHEQDLEIGISLRDTETIGRAQEISQETVVIQERNTTHVNLILETETEKEKMKD